ncbi:SusC/RagA family TonB-linked outer membrane protein [uncultured Maribacter sp.]|uniref:SusC/RagA family TonB-linked outer membrane protein n=1 Tax=uncultured Maribacter sp. TaxID=431308 RepID=UPI002635A1DA|nr:SusC/RagA family TonB-linked outer membrane protein [uncultured Maribacter sp.]
MTKNVLKLLFMLSILFCYSMQAQTTVSGTVVDPSGLPLPGVNITEKGTSNGVSTDFDGNYSINANSSSVLLFSYLGFVSQEITVGNQKTISITLIESLEALDEVVVTALGIKKEKKALAYAVQEVDSETITATANPNATSALQGKVAGVNITNSGGITGKPRIDIRGASSLSGNDQLLWVIDGVPFSTQDFTTDAEDLFGGNSNGGGFLDINPDDIESMSVLKGGPAAALYGARGGNGVVLITTKSGKRSQGLGISYTGSTTFSKAGYFLDTQKEYGQGIDGVYDSSSRVAWGPRFDGVERVAWTGESIPYQSESNLLEDFTRTGVSTRHAITFTKGSEDGNFKVLVSKDDTQGIYEGQALERLNFDFKANYDINPWLNVDAKVSYINTQGFQRPTIGRYSFVSFFNTTPANIRTQDLSPGFIFEDSKNKEILYGPSAVLTENANANNRNPYFLQAQTFNNDQRNRSFGYLAANVKFSDALRLKVKYGLDIYRYEQVFGTRFEDQIFFNNSPSINTSESFFKEENSEFLLSYTKDLNEDFNFGVSVGGNQMRRGVETLNALSGKLDSESTLFLNAGTNVQANEEFIDEEIHSLYGFADASYKNYLFLNATVRNDWSSTLPTINNSFLYSSVGLSALISEMVEMPDWMNYLKVRGTWAEVGKASTPQTTNPTFNVFSSNFNLSQSTTPNEGVDPNLQPEISTTTEFGVEFRLLNNRLNFDIALYDERTRNQIAPVPVNSTGLFSTLLTNVGEISNKGIEVYANIVPIKTEDFNLGLTLNFGTNKGVIEELPNGTDFFPYFTSNTIIEEVRGYEGEKYGDIYGFKYQRDNAGNIIVGADGLPATTSEKEKIGNIQADFTGSVGLNATYKSFSLNTLFIMQQGGDIYSLTEASATGSGNTPKTLSFGRDPFFTPNGVLADGSTNTTIVSAQSYWQTVSGISEEFLYDASFMKLGEVSLGYSLPKSTLNSLAKGFLSDVKISVIGRNLFYLFRNTPGTVPDAGVFNSSVGGQAFDFSAVPVERTYGVSLNVKF